MCDGCGEIFSENADGWASQTASITKRDQNGKPYTLTAQLDKCVNCVEIEMNRSNVPSSARMLQGSIQPHYERTEADD
jgi:hypothetical protein